MTLAIAVVSPAMKLSITYALSEPAPSICKLQVSACNLHPCYFKKLCSQHYGAGP